VLCWELLWELESENGTWAWGNGRQKGLLMLIQCFFEKLFVPQFCTLGIDAVLNDA
jgi:hypothetical protein